MKYVLFSGMLLLAGNTRAQPADIRKVQSAITTGFVINDTNSLKNFVDDAFILIHADSTRENKQQFIHSFDKYKPDDALSIMLQHSNHTEHQDKVVVEGVRLTQWLEGDELLRSKTPYKDTYQKKKDKWTLISSMINDTGEPYYALGDTSGMRSQIAEKYRILERSFHKKDPDMHHSVKTKDFAMAGPDGHPVAPAVVKAQMRSMIATLRGEPEMTNVIEGMEIAEDTVKVTVLQTFKRKQLVDGNIKNIESIVKQRTSWMRTRDGFKLVYIDRMEPISMKVDGEIRKPEAPLAPKE